jgi:hypothetical protein
MVGREARNNADPTIAALANQPACRDCADELAKKGVRVVGVKTTHTCACGKHFTIAERCVECFGEVVKKAKEAELKRACRQAREALQRYCGGRPYREATRELVLKAQIAFATKNLEAEIKNWVFSRLLFLENPSAIFEVTETTARLSWLVIP